MEDAFKELQARTFTLLYSLTNGVSNVSTGKKLEYDIITKQCEYKNLDPDQMRTELEQMLSMTEHVKGNLLEMITYLTPPALVHKIAEPEEDAAPTW